MKAGSIPTIGLVRAELGYFASTTEPGRLNTVLNVAYEYIDQLETEIKYLNSEVARLEKETQH
jgi:hypothetical protein